MMEKKSQLIICVLIFIIVLLSGLIVYDKFLSNNNDEISKENNQDNGILNNDGMQDTANKEDVNSNENKITGNYKDYTEDCSVENEKCTIKYTFNLNNNYQSTVSVDDTFSIINEPTLGKRFFILNNGTLYYDIEKCNDGYCNYMMYDLDESYNGYLSGLKKYTDVSNIKRIKSYNHSTGVDWSLFLITENGKVYSLYYNEFNNKFNLDIEKDFSKYNVDDIIEYDAATGPGGSKYKIILQDGTILTKSIVYED